MVWYRMQWLAHTVWNGPGSTATFFSLRSPTVHTQQETLKMLAEISVENNIGLVLVTHDEMIAKKWAHKDIQL